jgi:hypothetical protein
MLLPDNFQFSQNNLQDYADCARRFQLRHILHQEWPAVQTEPVLLTEQLIELGQNFHRLVFQNHSGISEESISKSTKDPELEVLWQNYIKSGPAMHEQQTKSEFTLSIPFSGSRLIARYDLLVFHPESKVVIYDWKTSRKQPKQNFMLERIQSKIYPLVLSLAGYPPNEPISPVKIEMIYWYPYHPSTPISFNYNLQQQKEDQLELENMVKEILEFQEPIFPLTMDLTKCRFCLYRSLCERGDKAGNLEELESMDGLPPDLGWDLDFNKIEEIAFCKSPFPGGYYLNLLLSASNCSTPSANPHSWQSYFSDVELLTQILPGHFWILKTTDLPHPRNSLILKRQYILFKLQSKITKELAFGATSMSTAKPPRPSWYPLFEIWELT